MTQTRVDADAVAVAYDEWSAAYDSDANATRDLDAAVLRKQALLRREGDVLELGCGTGKNTEWLSETARTIVALDFSDGMLERARKRIRSNNVRFARHDIREPWPVESATYDLVVENLVLEHIEHVGPFFSEAARVLKPMGQLYACELHPFRQLQGKVAQFRSAQTGEKVHVRAHLHDVSEFLRAGLKAGLRLIDAGDWRDADAPSKSAPRLFSMLWERPRL
jgi:ubiquinone/menaquinone biosynthesis C-methylase UbiE